MDALSKGGHRDRKIGNQVEPDGKKGSKIKLTKKSTNHNQVKSDWFKPVSVLVSHLITPDWTDYCI